MSLSSPVPRSELGTRFTHYGWMCGLCPVYVGGLASAGPEVEPRNWVPEFWFEWCLELYGAFTTMATLLNPTFEPEFGLLITGPIEPEAAR